jgi:hypothetical protein
MKFAYLVMTELRSINKTIHGLYDHIIDYYNADVFICVQNYSENDHENIKLFNKNVVYSEIYQKPEPSVYFGVNHNLNANPIFDGSWNIKSNLQIYINYHKMSKIIRDSIDKYDYFITIRPDITILYPFPSKEIFESIPEAIYSFDPNYCRSWGGCGFSMFVHKKFIMSYLSCYYNIISSINYKDLINLMFNKLKNGFNQENFQTFCLKLSNIYNYKKYIKNINYYYTAEKLDDYTTWSTPTIHPKYNVVCKYEKQCEDAYSNLKLWISGCKWKYNDNCIYLQLS